MHLSIALASGVDCSKDSQSLFNRARLKTDTEAQQNFASVTKKRVILREERNFVEIVDGTFERTALSVQG